MKKINIIPWWPVISFVVIVSWAIVESCNPKEKKPGTVLVTPKEDTSRVIDTTIIEPGDAPIADNTLAKGKPDKKVKEKIICSFGHKKFNKNKRPIELAPGGVKGKKPKPTKPPVVEPPPPPPPDEPPTTGSGGTIYLDFYGGTFTNTMWASSLTVTDAGFSQPEIDYVTTATAAHFTEYNVIVTTDESVFNSTPIGRRVRVVITESWEWFGQSGGVAYLNSFFWTDNSPAFVFSLLLNYNTHNVAEAAAHEAGHTLGLRHQSVCENGIITNQYNWGYQGQIAWVAPTMGASYQAVLGDWYPDGPTPLGCDVRQNDVAILTSAIGKK